MKKNLYFVWMIIIILAAALAGCSKDGDSTPKPPDPGPNDTIHNPGSDSVVIAINIKVPLCTILSSVEIKFWHPALPNGYFDVYYGGDNRFFRYVYKGDIAKAMIGTDCDFYPCLEGGCNGLPASLYLPGGTQTEVLHKGVNPVILEYAIKPH